jgi:hypothetical protein
MQTPILHEQNGALTRMYRSVVLSTLRYGEQVYGSAHESNLQTLEDTHKKGIHAALGAFCITKTGFK